MTEIIIFALIVILVVAMEVLVGLRPTWLRLFWLETRWKLAEWRDALVLFSAYLLPRWLVSAAAIRLITHATVSRYGNTVVPELTAMTALQRWETSND